MGNEGLSNQGFALAKMSAIYRSRITVAVIFGLLLALVPNLLVIENSDFYKAYFPAADSVLNTGTFQYSTDGFKSFANLPIVAYLFVPLVSFGEKASGTLFLVSEVAIYFAAFLAALRYLPRTTLDNWMLFFLFVFSRHYYTSIQFGQLTILAFLFLMLAFIAYQRNRQYLTGALVTLAFLIKIPAGFLFLYFLYKREYRTVAASAGLYIALVLISLIAFGLQLHVVYFDYTVLSNAGTTLTAYNNPTISALAMRFLITDGLFVWQLVSVPTYISIAVTAAILGLIAVLGKVIGYRRANSLSSRNLEFAIAVGASLVVFPLVWDHYYLFTIIPLFVAYKAISESESESKRLHIGMWAVAFVLVNLPVLSLIDAELGVIPFVATVASSPFFKNLMPSAPLLGAFTLLFLLVRLYRQNRSLAEADVLSQDESNALDNPDSYGLPLQQSAR